jgi:chromosome segregation ATPase
MVGVEELLGKGDERRVDTAKLVIYLQQLGRQLEEMETRLDAHTEHEEEQQKQVKELLDALTQFKGMIVIVRWTIYIGAPLFAAIIWLKEHVRI